VRLLRVLFIRRFFGIRVSVCALLDKGEITLNQVLHVGGNANNAGNAGTFATNANNSSVNRNQNISSHFAE
jgi:hypothetical protein